MPGSADHVLLLKNVAYTIVVPSTVAIYVPWLLIPDQAARTGIWLFLSLILFLLGGAIYLWCIWDFAHVGQGTPAPFDPPTHLVVQGLYRYMRNPMYGGVGIFLFGWLPLFPSPRFLFYGLFMGLCFHLFVIFYEEPHLQKIFKSSYDEYRTHVGRWVPITNRKR